ncbi:type II toxin-antitoxin system Phd/YefM family antitoxin [Burkholderia alba]|uniref:type II toxin-antitoxin system Phd/YefM family antitoxin n=1 Tax=Burkholderia alba TaxID=2683677 RepID=UPI002B060187|nr:type II toxin-antitoxin system Phd/YefM family antitoxin [Burkholderia alba]
MTVMVRLALQGALDAECADELSVLFDGRNGPQVREALFSTIVDAMSSVAMRSRRPEGGRQATELPVSVPVLHDWIGRVFPGAGRVLAHDSARRLIPLVRSMLADRPATVKGYRLRVVESGARAPARPGDALDAVLRDGPLVVYDPDFALIVDLLPVESGPARAFAMPGALLEAVQQGELWIVDRHLDTRALLAAWPRRGGAFIAREHGGGQTLRELGPPVECGRVDGGRVYEQSVGISDELGSSCVFRRIEWHLDRPAGDRDAIQRFLTSVPAAHLGAPDVVDLARRTWSRALPVPLDRVFHGGAPALTSPRDAALACGVAALAYNVLSVIASALTSGQTLDERERERLPLQAATGVRATYAGMMIAVPGEFWRRYDHLTPGQLGRLLASIGTNVDSRSARKQRRELRIAPEAKAALRAASLDAMLCDASGGDAGDRPLAEQRAVTMATRDFSSNPSKALRDAAASPVMVTKYGQAIAFLISVEDWNRMRDEHRDRALSRIGAEYGGGHRAERYEIVR